MMEDSKIIELYWLRDESAIHATSQKYGAYLFKIAYNILADSQDSEESVNDTYLKAWNSMPPHRPAILSAFTGQPVRRDVAMTGEITLRGKVLPIGGLKEKALAASRIGIRDVIIPEENKKDVEEIPENVRKNLNVICVSDVDEVFRNAVTGMNYAG